ncbi:phosphoribosylformylglycinamidine synthase [Suttonella ornithocola]|uniref:Phosphoribosylformylglycinamidine synthase 2 n=1 Tax=Suttonella ornithocola TaxID=279832 RepID=A0A380MWA1_9GAMM|nr:phosphoribosylformylglycinamidine synthase [Suttonella ornithocola]SUO96870.1 Phosphoribosylformylglycinamidine synthase 2 [Suttonella ornithocola]
MFQRIFIRKRLAFRQSAFSLSTLQAQLQLPELQEIEAVAIYDIYHAPENIEKAVNQIFADSVTDEVLKELPRASHIIVVEPLPGQFDQRADSAEQCLRLISDDYANTQVRTANAYLIKGEINEEGLERLKHFLINPIESREKDLSNQTLLDASQSSDIAYYPDLLQLQSEDALAEWHQNFGLAMSLADLLLVQRYFQEENRAPSETEIRVLDTYWSDHCRHTTFLTELQNIRFPENALGQEIRLDFEDFLDKRRMVYGAKADSRPVTLMELATIDAKYLRSQGKLEDVEFSEEVNACSVFVDVDENDTSRSWLLQFKNETHNHPTEIEPFGGASTCIGGAIRDPLSGRAYVYQAMRISGSADPRENIKDTLPGKLPQRVIAERSAAGASSYGNQIGLATGQIVEFYHEGYKAKHMEVGAVVAATPAEHVRREVPKAGDLVLLLGGATGRDGCGGATGSSKEHHQDSLAQSAAEVQKGNPPEERKLQRLFRKGEFARKIKRCNDFGAGGVSVAVGELAESLEIDLDCVPTKYQGLNGTELAISESQERMAIVIAPEDLLVIQQLAATENLQATHIATVTDNDKLIMRWRGEVIVSLSRNFLDSHGAKTVQQEVQISAAKPHYYSEEVWQDGLRSQLKTLNFADQRGLGDRFDFNVGASCVLKPYGGYYQATPTEASVYKLPVETKTNTASILAYGFYPEFSAQSPYHGGMYAVCEAAARLIAVGGNLRTAHFSLQEYFPKLGSDAVRWGWPTSALLGAHHALKGIERAAIGGKDSMSGSFGALDVPPTLIAFAVGTVAADKTISAEFKQAEHQLYWLRCPQDNHGRPDFSAILEANDFIQEAIDEGIIASIRSIRHGGVIQAIYESAIGNKIGVKINELPDAFLPEYGGFLISSEGGLGIAPNLLHLGYTIAESKIVIGSQSLDLSELEPLTQSLADIYPLNGAKPEGNASIIEAKPLAKARPITTKIPTPRICLPVFPGTNSELDTAKAFVREGGIIEEIVICNNHQTDIQNSLNALVKSLDNCQIFALSGGFSAGDEPDGSGKFIANIIFEPHIQEAIARFLARDGLILGICNGFQALVKTGLLPYGEVKQPKIGDPTLAHNRIGRHIARIATTIISNNASPWLSEFIIGEAHDVALSHGEGRFYCSDEALDNLIENGQVAIQYADPKLLIPTMHPSYNPNGSLNAIEAITSPCGRILGKMGHSERWQDNLYRNHYPTIRPQNIFRAGIKAFR